MKIKMKKVFLFLLAAVVITAFAACNNTQATERPEVPGGAEASENPSDGSASEPAPDETDGSEYGNLETGVIVYSDGATLMICSLDDRNLSFLVAGDEVDKSEARGLVEGSEVDVYYIGDINGSDTSAAQVTKLVQSQKQAAIRTDMSVTGGVILESDGAVLKISTFNGDEWTFLIAGEEVDKSASEGLAVGDYVTVFYEGEITDDRAEDVNVVKLVQ